MTWNARTRTRTRKSRLYIALPVVTVVCAVAVSAFAIGGKYGGRSRGGGPDRMIERVLDEAGADEAQREQIRAIMQGAHVESREARSERRKAFHQRVIDILAAETVDARALEALRAEHLAEMNVHLAQMSEAWVAAANVLSAEQRVAAAEALREHVERRGSRGFGRRGDCRYEREAADDRG